MLAYQKIVRFIEDKIDHKIWSVGEKIPSIRTLMQQHSVAKNTIIRALIELEKNGLLFAKPQAGYFVRKRPSDNQAPQQQYPQSLPSMVSVPEIFYDIMQRSAAFDILPNLPAAPFSNHLIELHRNISKAQRNNRNATMYYDAPLGSKQLREQISARYRLRNSYIDADELCITFGCQHALFLALFVTCQPGDNVVVESPAFYGVVQLLEQLQINIIEVSASPVGGIDTKALAAVAQQWPIKACVVTPSFATPTGATMSEQAKQHLITLANQHDFAVIEDDIYGELSFEQPVSPLKSFDSDNRVILCSSFSKSLSRDLRLGWIAAARWMPDVIRLKLTSQLASNQTTQQGIAEFISKGNYRRHLNYFTHQLMLQRNQLISALQQYWPQDIRYTLPNGGIALWIELSANHNTTELYQHLISENIVITPGNLFSCSNCYPNYLRLSFNHPTTGKRLNAIKKLGKLLSS
ncbi:transcriptional regulator [Thalassotalea insulae]|uniref:Transcriptional regulator n=1 Tax=Thalassotalea insulae TaxID=2056778 RepID=A0ABQ6GUQ6_9GAMM|nr:PLP-dependent aminotransferase family protein [Thalassotalea insulae]GLX79072.1 transcriptional regulator [Thalassotalea insulae]